jgi:hypothetical protein
MKSQKGFTTAHLIVVVFFLAAIGGWVANIVKLAGCSFDPLTGIVIIRAIGVVVAPLGAVMGFI